MDLTDNYRIFHPTSAQYTLFFSSAHGTFSKIDHILGHKANLSKYKKTEIIPWILSDSQCIKTRTQEQQAENMQQLEAE
jgi:hypothetical protein